jgi:hypothetical protein
MEMQVWLYKYTPSQPHLIFHTKNQPGRGLDVLLDWVALIQYLVRRGETAYERVGTTARTLCMRGKSWGSVMESVPISRTHTPAYSFQVLRPYLIILIAMPVSHG